MPKSYPATCGKLYLLKVKLKLKVLTSRCLLRISEGRGDQRTDSRGLLYLPSPLLPGTHYIPPCLQYTVASGSRCFLFRRKRTAIGAGYDTLHADIFMTFCLSQLSYPRTTFQTALDVQGFYKAVQYFASFQLLPPKFKPALRTRALFLPLHLLACHYLLEAIPATRMTASQRDWLRKYSFAVKNDAIQINIKRN